jgi:uncharacterized protein YqeY
VKSFDQRKDSTKQHVAKNRWTLNQQIEPSIGLKYFDQRKDSTKQHVAEYRWTLNQQIEGTIDRFEIL